MKVKVYVALYNDGPDIAEYHRAYGSRQQAEDAISQYPRWEQVNFTIEEEEVDIPDEAE